jgi:hypothetical protein
MQDLRLEVVLQKESVDREIEANSRLVDDVTKREGIERLHSIARFFIDPESNGAPDWGEEASIGSEIDLDITGLKGLLPDHHADFKWKLWEQRERPEKGRSPIHPLW